MAGPKPQDEYNPTASVSPTTQAPNDTLSVRASPQDFGSAIGQAAQGAGREITGAGNELFQTGIQIQGLANEHAANAAEMQLAVQGGQIYDDYKSKTGLEAANSKDGYVQQYLALNNKIREGLSSPQAQRAYDTLATRRLSFTIQDMNSYASGQRKEAYKNGNLASIAMSVDQGSKYDVASNPEQFNFERHNILFQINAAYTAPEYGRYTSIGAKTNEDGTLSFDQSTDEGKIAQNDYNNFVNQKTGELWENSIKTLANDPIRGNIEKAVKALTDNKDQIPAATYAKLSSQLSAPYRSEQARVTSDSTLSKYMATYDQSVSSAASVPNNLGNVKTGDLSGFQSPSSPTDGAILTANNLRSGYQGLTLEQIAKKWTGEGPEKVADWIHNVSSASGLDPKAVPNLNDPKVLRSVLKGISVAEKSPTDRTLFTDDVIGAGVDASLSGKQASLSSTPSPINEAAKAYTTKAAFLQSHWDDVIQQTRKNAADQGFDLTVQDLAEQRVTQRMSEVISAQAHEDKASEDFIYRAITDPKNPYTDVDQLDKATNPQIRELWSNYQQSNPKGANGVRKFLTSNSRGQATTFGTDFSNHFSQVLDGNVPDVMALGNYITPNTSNSPLTNTGVKILRDQAEILSTPNGAAFGQEEKTFLAHAKGIITGASIYPGFVNSKIREEGYNKWLQTALPKIVAGYKNGKTADDLFHNDKSPDFLGKTVIPPSSAELQTAGDKSMYDQLANDNEAGGAGPKYNSKEDLQKAVHSGTITKQDAIKWAQANGKVGTGEGSWFHLNAPGPEVPKPFQGE